MRSALSRTLLWMNAAMLPKIYIAILFCFVSTGFSVEPQVTRITPKWIQQNADRIELTLGTAFSGRNDYFIRLTLDESAVCRIHTKMVATKTAYEQQPPDLAMYETTSRTDSPTEAVRLTFSENKPYSLKPIYPSRSRRSI